MRRTDIYPRTANRQAIDPFAAFRRDKILRAWPIARFVTLVTSEKRVPDLYTDHAMQETEAPMNMTVHSRVAIQARIAEWQHQFRNSNDGSAQSFFRSPVPDAERVRWLRAA